MERQQQNKQARGTGKGGQVASSNQRFSNNCLNLLLSTSYIILSEERLKLIRTVNSAIDILNILLNVWREDASTEYVEVKIEQALPEVKTGLAEFMQIMSQLRFDYANENYIEPEVPVICLSKQEHEQYLKLTE